MNKKVLNRFWYHIKYIFYAKKKWGVPKQSKVLIYDAANSEILLKYLSPWNPEFLHVRGEQFYVWIFLKSLFKKGRRIDNYIDLFIELVNPILIVTIIDNKSTFYSISLRHPKRKTLFIQNGIRSYNGDVFGELDNLQKNEPDILRNFFVDYMLVIGSICGDRYAKYIKGNVLVTGSVKNNFVIRKNSPKKNTIAFISQWRDTTRVYDGTSYLSFEDVFQKADNIVLQCLNEYAKKNRKRLFFILCYRGDKESNTLKEKAYYKKLLGGEIEILSGEEPFSSYNAIDMAEVTIGIDSTLCYEAIARGGKAGIFPLRSTLTRLWDLRYGWPADFPGEGPFWTNKADPKSINRILDYLFEVNEEKWRNDLESTKFSSIMSYDSGNMKLNAIFKKELGDFI